MRILRIALLSTALTAAALISPAAAANINFHDLTDIVGVDATQFDVSGPVVTHMNIFNGEDDVEVTGQFFTNSPDGAGSNTAYLFEPGSAFNGSVAVSDIITSNWTVLSGIATLTVDFGSDPPNSFCESPMGCLRVPIGSNGKYEDGTMQNINDILSLPQNITVQVQSDVDTPEPLTIALFGAGVAGLGALRRRGKPRQA